MAACSLALLCAGGVAVECGLAAAPVAVGDHVRRGARVAGLPYGNEAVAQSRPPGPRARGGTGRFPVLLPVVCVAGAQTHTDAALRGPWLAPSHAPTTKSIFTLLQNKL